MVRPEFNTFVQTKLAQKGEATLKLLLQYGQFGAASQLEVFLRKFLEVDGSKISSVEEWGRWVDNTHAFDHNWRDNLEYPAFLRMLGLPEPLVQEWCEKKMVEGEPKPTSLAHVHLRWFTKACVGFGLPASLADVVAAVMALMGWPLDRQPTESEVVALLDAFTARCEARNWDDLWVPDWQLLDGELDDLVAWGLFNFVRYQTKGEPLQTLWQFPPQLEKMAREVAWSGCHVFVDPDAHNASALLLQWCDQK